MLHIIVGIFIAFVGLLAAVMGAFAVAMSDNSVGGSGMQQLLYAAPGLLILVIGIALAIWG